MTIKKQDAIPSGNASHRPPDWTKLTQEIDRAEAKGTKIGLSIVMPAGHRFSHRGDQDFLAASATKLPIMVELFRQIDSGKLSLEQRHALLPGEKTTGMGIVKYLHDGIEFTLGDLLYLMISLSDNSASNILSDLAGMANVNAMMRSIGMAHSVHGRKFYGRSALPGEQENVARPDEYASLMARLLDGQAASPGACAQMLRLLESQYNNRRIGRHLAQFGSPRWGSKTGTLPGVVNDVGFVTTQAGPLVIAAFCGAVPDAFTGEAIIGGLTRAALTSNVNIPDA